MCSLLFSFHTEHALRREALEKVKREHGGIRREALQKLKVKHCALEHALNDANVHVSVLRAAEFGNAMTTRKMGC